MNIKIDTIKPTKSNSATDSKHWSRCDSCSDIDHNISTGMTSLFKQFLIFIKNLCTIDYCAMIVTSRSNCRFYAIESSLKHPFSCLLNSAELFKLGHDSRDKKLLLELANKKIIKQVILPRDKIQIGILNQKSMNTFCLTHPVSSNDNTLQIFLLLAKTISSSQQHLEIKNTNIAIRQFEQLVDQVIPNQKVQTNQPSQVVEQFEELKKEHEQLIVKSEQFAQMAQYDSLTGLYNRAALEERLEWLINLAERNERRLAVVLLDLDGFKKINDSLGHKAGDELIKEVARRLRENARKIDTIGRIGGDEFILVLNNIESKTETFEIIKRILVGVAEPMQLEHRTIKVTSSIGFSLYPDDGTDAELLLKYADSAMYQAKKSGKDNFQYYSQALHDEIVERIKLEDELSSAIKEKQFVLHYQPQVDIKTGVIIGVEALVRWQHPHKGLIYPDDFISLAEEVGLISNIGDWVFEESLEQINRWESSGVETVPISINVSVNQLRYEGFIPYLKSKLIEKAVNANMITIEITESLSLGEQEKYLSILEQLKEIGFRISMDDFGTGYSNLTYLKRFPIDEIKIDKGFIDNITQNPHDKAIATTIIAIAHNLNFDVIAEGVETKSQLALLASYNCDTMQGYYFSQPKPAEEIGKLLQTKSQMSLQGVLPEGYQRIILIVDDEKEILLALKRSLRKTGAKIITAQSAEEALELLALNKVGVILSDLSMPDINGIELLDRVHQMYPNTLRMILSGLNEFELACDAINRSAIFRFITKPWSDDLLREEIKKAFKIYESTVLGNNSTEGSQD